MSTTDLFHTMIQSDGEAIVAGDMNDQQRFILAQLFDQVLSSIAPSISRSTSNDPEFTGQLGSDMLVGPYAYALNPGGAYPRQGTTNAKIQIAPGTLLQKVDAASGDDPTLIPYTFIGTEEVTIAPGDASHPRVDIVQMKLEYVESDSQSRDFEDAVTDVPSTSATNKKRLTRCTLSVKQGVAAASPVYPDPDAGYCVIAGVVVGTLYAAAAGILFEDSAGAVAVLHDQRMPLRVRAHGVFARDFIFAGGHTEENRNLVQKTDASGNELWIPYMGGSQCGRLIAIAASFYDAAPLTSRIRKHDMHDAAGFEETFAFLAKANLDGGSTAFTRRCCGPLEFEGSSSAMFDAGPVVQESVVNLIGTPIWTNGKRAPTETFLNDSPAHYTFISLTFVASAAGSQFGPATFYIAEGL